MKNYIRVTSEFTAGGIQMKISIYDELYMLTDKSVYGNTIDRLYGLRNKNAKKLNLFLDKYSDAEPIDDSIDGGGKITKKNIEEIREYLQ